LGGVFGIFCTVFPRAYTGAGSAFLFTFFLGLRALARQEIVLRSDLDDPPLRPISDKYFLISVFINPI
jgi:cytochrome bd-type quinol oxidase subunit 2